MEKSSFSITYDYRCPFARNANEHVVAAIRAEAPLSVRFVPFVLGPAYGVEGASSAWDDPAERPELTSLAASLVVRDRLPDQFLDAHLALFSLRHEQGGDLRDDKSIQAALSGVGIDSARVYKELEEGWPFELLRSEHEDALIRYSVFGVPTFIHDDQAVFVRLMTRPMGDGALATETIQLVLDLVRNHVALNEFKHTTISR